MEKLRKALEKEQEMDKKVQEIVQANRRDEVPILDQSYFYPNQTNKMPKYIKPGEQDAAKEQFKQEIEKQRSEILTDEEYA